MDLNICIKTKCGSPTIDQSQDARHEQRLAMWLLLLLLHWTITETKFITTAVTVIKTSPLAPIAAAMCRRYHIQSVLLTAVQWAVVVDIVVVADAAAPALDTAVQQAVQRAGPVPVLLRRLACPFISTVHWLCRLGERIRTVDNVGGGGLAVAQWLCYVIGAVAANY